jgi:hypothetical protein
LIFEIIMKKINTSLVALILLIISGHIVHAQVTNSQSFDGTTFPPAGWSNIQASGSGLWSRATTGSNPTQSPRSGAGEAMFNCFSYSPGTNALLITPSYDLRARGPASVSVSFWMYRDATSSYNNSSYADKVDAYINTAANLSGATLLGTVNRAAALSPVVASSGWYLYSFNVPLSFNSNTNYFILSATSEFGDNIYIDDVEWISYPCTDLGGTASSNSTICAGSTTSLSLTGYTAAASLQWQSSTDNISWVNITGATSASFTSSALSTTTYFRCAATYTCTVYSTVVTTTVIQPATGGTISGPAMLCSGSSASLILSAYSGTIQWQSSPDNSNWTNISGATSSTYSSGALTSTTYFRAIVTGISPCSTSATSISSSFTVTVISSGGVWKGTSSNNWNTAANWCGGVPTNATDVFIPAGTPFAPTIPGGITDPNAVCRDITIYPGATLTVSTGTANSFKIYGNVLNNGTLNHTSSSSIVPVASASVKTYWILLEGVNKIIGGTGSFANAAISVDNSAMYTLANSFSVSGIRSEQSPTGTLNFSSYTLTAVNYNQQYGTYNLNTGTFWDKMFAQAFTTSTFNNNSGTWVWDITGKVSSGSFNIQDDDWNNVRVICDPGYYIELSGITNLNLNGNLTIDPNTIFRDGNYPISLKGNWINNGSYVSNSIGSGGTPTVTFNGSASQYIGGTSATTFYNLTINNTSSTGVTLNQPTTVNKALILTDGYVYSTSTNLLTISNGGTSTQGSSISFVDGPMKKIGTSAFVFPVGTNNLWARIAMSAETGTTSATDAFTAQYFDVPYSSLNPVAAPNAYVSSIEHWIFNRTSGTANTFVTLFWESGARSGINTFTNDLHVARWDGSIWLDHGNGGMTGSVSAGSIQTSAAVTNFSPFTFASISVPVTTNPLPIELVEFTGKCNGSNAILNWSTASENNNDYFTVEKSTDGQHYLKTGSIKGSGNSNSTIKYSLTDYNTSDGIAYYRLKQTDYNGKTELYKTINIEGCETSVNNLNVFNNDQGNIVLDIQSSGSWNFNVILFDASGNKIMDNKIRTEPGNNNYKFDASFLNTGIYFIKIDDGKKPITKKIFIRKEI